MRLLFLALITFLVAPIFSQNWLPINASDTFNYKRSDKAVISNHVWVDSITLNGNDTVYHMNRILWHCDGCNYGFLNHQNFLQARQVITPNGEVLLEGKDFFRLKPWAAVGDTWSIDSNYSMTAIVDTIYVDSIFGQLDSIKEISYATIPIKLSKNHGIISWPTSMIAYTHELVGIQNKGFGEVVPGAKEIYGYQIGSVIEDFWVDRPGFDYGNGRHRKYTIIDTSYQNDTMSIQVVGRLRGGNTSGLGTPVRFGGGIPIDSFWIHFAIDPLSEKLTGQVLVDSVVGVQGQGFHYCPNGSAYSSMAYSIDVCGNYKKHVGIIFIRPDVQSDSLVKIDSIGSGRIEITGQFNHGGSIAQEFGVGLGYMNNLRSNCFEGGFYEGIIAFTTPGGCTDGDFSPEFLFVGIPDMNQSKLFSIYPNPVSDHLVIENLYAQTTVVRLFNSAGQEVWTDRISANAKRELSIEFLPKGMYTALLQSGDHLTRKKLIKQ